jgi:transketolase
MNQPARFKAAGWDVQRVDGHDMNAVAEAIEKARKSRKPSLIACRTTIGKGAPNMQGSEKTHGAPLGADEIAATRANIGWAHEPFVVPDNIVGAWRAISKRGKDERIAWEGRLDGSARKKSFECRDCRRNAGAGEARHWQPSARNMSEQATKVATRKASEMALGSSMQEPI